MFNGTLLKVGGQDFPLQYVEETSYKINDQSRQDLDPFRNTTGVLTRNVVPHTITKIEITAKPLNNIEMSNLMTFLTNAMVNKQEKKVIAEYYSPSTDSYRTGEFYMPDFEYTIDYIDRVENKIFYDPFTIKFIEY